MAPQCGIVQILLPHANPFIDTTHSSGHMSDFSSKIDRFFHISERGSDIKTEVRGGIITFLAMFYILAVNPSILTAATSEELFNQLVTATAIAACVSCILMGLYANFPVALAPGMGINAFIAYTIVLGMGFTYYQALLVVLISGIVFFVLTVTGFRSKLLSCIPSMMKLGITAGIGFFIVMVGLFNAGIIEHGDGSALKLGNLASPGVRLAIACILITIGLWFRSRWQAVLFGIVIVVIVGYLGGMFLGWDTVVNGAQLVPGVGSAAITGAVSMPDFGLFGSMFSELTGFESALWPAFIISIISLVIVDMFDTAGTLLGLGNAAGIVDKDGNISGNEKALQVDSIATIFGAVAGTTTTTSFIESTTGINAGAKTGLMPVVTGILFFLAMFLAPFFAIITPACTVGALFLVGLLLGKSVKDIEWVEPVDVATAFITMFMMGLSGSITDGMALGMIVYIFGKCLTGKIREIPLMLWILGAIFIVYFVILFDIIPIL